MNTQTPTRPECAIIAERRINEHHNRPRRWLQPGPREDEGELIPVLAEMRERFARARARVDAVTKSTRSI